MSDPPAPRHIRFSTADLPPRDRFAAFCEGMFRNIVGADIEETGEGAFAGALDIRFAGSVIVADIAVTPARISRRMSHTRDGDDAIVVQLWQRGSAGLLQEEKAQRVEARDALIIDNAKPAMLSPDMPARFWALTIPRGALMASASATRDVRGGKISSGAACRLLRGYLDRTRDHEFDASPSSRLLGDHFVDLAAAALLPHVDRLADSDGIRAARRAAILREIERRSADTSLNAAAVARLLGVTPRYVHLLLEETRKSFTHHVLERRLEKAAVLLRDPRRWTRKIAEIAAEAGFTDLSYFNRAFRRHFNMTPSDCRHGNPADKSSD